MPSAAQAGRLIGGLGDEVARVSVEGWLSPVLLVDGRIAGVWGPERRGGFLGVTTEPFGRVEDFVRAGAEREARRLARYFGDELELGWE